MSLELDKPRACYPERCSFESCPLRLFFVRFLKVSIIWLTLEISSSYFLWELKFTSSFIIWSSQSQCSFFSISRDSLIYGFCVPYNWLKFGRHTSKSITPTPGMQLQYYHLSTQQIMRPTAGHGSSLRGVGHSPPCFPNCGLGTLKDLTFFFLNLLR